MTDTGLEPDVSTVKGWRPTIRPIGHIPELCRKGIWRPRIYGNSFSTDHVSFASALMRRGTEGLRTLNLLLARQALSQLELRPHILLQIKTTELYPKSPVVMVLLILSLCGSFAS